MCRDSAKLANLYRVCADYTEGPGELKRWFCPLDPNGLPLKFEIEERCDDEWEAIKRTGWFDRDFELLDGDEVPQCGNCV